MKFLILFSGTGSLEKVIPKGNEVRGLDLSNKYKPYYNKDILTWDYQSELSTWVPDYIHSSFVCCRISNLNKNRNTKKNKSETYVLVDKTIEIIEFVRTLNPKIKFTIENPKKKSTIEYEPLTHYHYVNTTYCKYGYGYQKPTTFWYGGFNLKLEPECRKNDETQCKSRSKNNGIHWLRCGVSRNSKTHFLHNGQSPDTEHFKNLKTLPKYKGFSHQDFRFRIPKKLCKSIILQVME